MRFEFLFSYRHTSSTEIRTILEEVLTEVLEDNFNEFSRDEIEQMIIFNHQRQNRYLLITSGWEGESRVHACIVHLDIIEGKIWVQRDSIEDGIALDLLAKGIPKLDIVLGFHPPKIRQYLDFAVG